jgi:hypothetical protein
MELLERNTVGVHHFCIRRIKQFPSVYDIYEKKRIHFNYISFSILGNKNSNAKQIINIS